VSLHLAAAKGASASKVAVWSADNEWTGQSIRPGEPGGCIIRFLPSLMQKSGLPSPPPSSFIRVEDVVGRVWSERLAANLL
jgi:hypothetical protein